MKQERVGSWLLLLVMCASGALCQDTDSSEDEAVTDDYIFTSVLDFVNNVTGSLPSGEEAANVTQQVFGSNMRNWFQNIVPNDEYIASCGGMSTSEKTVWQNSEYPLMEKLPGFCTLSLLPPAGTCALRIHFVDLDLRSDDPEYWCFPSEPFFKATTPDDLTAVYCQKLDGYEGILPISDTTKPTILLLQLDPGAEFQFKVSTTAVNCNDIKTYESPSDCGIKNQDLKTMRAELFGNLASEQTQDPFVAEFGDSMPLAYRQRRRTYDTDSQSKGQKMTNKNNKDKNTSNNDKRITTTYVELILHPVLEKFKEGIAAAELAGTISKPNGDRVIGKETSLVNEWPWIVYIERNIADFGVIWSCNGLLLDNSKVLTSRDCVGFIAQQPFGVADISVRIGDHDISSTEEVKSKTVGISKVTVPLRKNKDHGTDDAFAILHLKEEVQLSDTIRPICLPVSYNKFPDSGLVAGWDFDYGTPLSPLPAAARVKVLDQADCQKAVEELYSVPPEEIKNYDVTCAADKFGIGVVCSGELGSALTQRDRRGAYYVTGVAGGAQECFYEGVPTIFSKIEPDNRYLNIALG